ncbi:MAG TPA: hypothetical protein VF469_23845, partial [Kofleriaceae bacterium]
MSDEVTEDLLAFLGASPTPFHAVDEGRRRLEAAGFHPLDEADRWDRLADGAYYVTSSGSNLIAFVLPPPERRTGFRIVGAHTDSPNLRLKPNAEYASEGYAQLGVEVYGGALLNSWLDRDLGLAGRVLVKADGGIESRLVRLDRPVLRVPQLAIHLDRDVNDKGLVLNRQEHLAPVLGLVGAGGGSLGKLVAGAAGVAADRVLGHELM